VHDLGSSMPVDCNGRAKRYSKESNFTLPRGKERMRRLTSIVAAKRFPFRDLVTHPFRLAEIETAYDLFSHQRDGVMNVAIRP
jgi:alcohol dehydrogenase